MTSRSVIIFAVGALLLTFIAISFGCDKINGERTVSGKIPLESNTEEAERIANSLTLPEGSSLLVTRVRSKEESGVVTKKYSTLYDCEEVDSYFRNYLTSNDWKLQRSIRKAFFFFQDTLSSFSRDDFSIEVWCTQMKDFRGNRHFYISSSW